MGYPASTWAKMKAEYETGNFSAQSLGEKWGISVKSVEKHIADDGWKKGKLKHKIELQAEKTAIEKFAALGMPEEKVFQKVCDLMNHEEADVCDKGLKHYETITGNIAAKKVQHSGKIAHTNLPATEEECLRALADLDADDNT